MKLRDYQATGTAKVVAYLKYPHRHPCVAVPTGGGKSIMIADLCRAIKEFNPDAKIIVLSHTQEILVQDHATMEKYLDRPIGMFSAGIGIRRMSDIMVGGIQSVHRLAEQFASYTHIIIDEAHSISKNEGTMYASFFEKVKAQRIGFTATPFRLGDGLIYGQGKQFTELAYDLTSAHEFVKLVEDGYLCKLTMKGTEVKLDTDDLKILAGDFSEKDMSKKFDKSAITIKAVDELIKRGADRKKWLIFAIDINHAEHITEALLRRGVAANVVHSKMGDNRERVIHEYKAGKYRAIVNVNVLTTGFDDPSIDLIALLRPTQSPVLHVQTVGRGLRISEGKKDCLILDFAGNVSRLGPVNNITIKEKGKGAKGGEPAMKECPVCSLMVYPSVRTCPDCAHAFVFKTLITATPDDNKIIDLGEKNEAFYNVQSVHYSIVRKIGNPSLVKVTYLCGSKTFSEWLCIEHTGYAKTKADHWIKFRGGSKCHTVDEFMEQKDNLKSAIKIRVVKKGGYGVVEESYFRD